MPALAFIIQVQALILLQGLARRAVHQMQPGVAIARPEPLPLLLGLLIARAAELPRRIIARPAIARLQQPDIARRAGSTQGLRARRPGRSQAVRAVPGQPATRRDGSAINGLLDIRSSLHIAQIAWQAAATRSAQNGFPDFPMLFSFAEDCSKLKTASGRRIFVSDPGLKTGATNLFGVMSGGVVFTNVLNGGNVK
jgi:hypothetical protein